MTTDQVVLLMQSSKNENEWNDNCDKVKKAFGGYPNWWYHTIILSGFAGNVMNSWSK